MTDKTDRELLELAARAAGYQVDTGFADCPLIYGEDAGPDGPREWNPLTDDDDALRLLRRLELDISHDNERHAVSVTNQSDVLIEVGMSDDAGDIYAPLRRAIVRAAASIGEQMK